jgi:hypothetical protein
MAADSAACTTDEDASAAAIEEDPVRIMQMRAFTAPAIAHKYSDLARPCGQQNLDHPMRFQP